MIEIILLLALVTLTTTAMLRVWLYSKLTNPLIEYLLVKRTAMDASKGWNVLPKMLFQLLTCWQCLSIWVGCFVSVASCWALHIVALQGASFWIVTLCVGLSAALLSEILDYYVLSAISVTHMDEEDFSDD